MIKYIFLLTINIKIKYSICSFMNPLSFVCRWNNDVVSNQLTNILSRHFLKGKPTFGAASLTRCCHLRVPGSVHAGHLCVHGAGAVHGDLAGAPQTLAVVRTLQRPRHQCDQHQGHRQQHGVTAGSAHHCYCHHTISSSVSAPRRGVLTTTLGFPHRGRRPPAAKWSQIFSEGVW